MVRWSEFDVHAHEARRAPKSQAPAVQCEVESKLHDQIIAECNRREWVFIHSRMDLPATTANGTADFIILRNDGRTLVVECKKKGSKPTQAQLGFLARCRKLGHIAEVVWNFDEFTALASR